MSPKHSDQCTVHFDNYQETLCQIQLNQEAYIDKAPEFNTLYLIEINDEMELGLQETYNSLGGIAHQELKG